MRLIDADALIKAVEDFPNCYNGWSDAYDKAFIIEAIEDAPTIEADRKTENDSEKPNNCEPKICDTCRYYNSNIPCGSTPSACKEADKFAKEFVDGLKKLKPKVEPTISKMEQVDKDINVRSKDEPQTDCPWK